MLKLAVAVLAVALAGTAGAAGWKDLRIDGSSEAAFKRSLDAFKEQLSPERQQVFTAALSDIWLQGTEKAQAEQRQFTVDEYCRQLHGLGYDEVVTLTDPTGETAKERYREATRRNVYNPSALSTPSPGSQKERLQRNHEGLDQGELMRGRQGGSTTPHSNEGTCCRQE